MIGAFEYRSMENIMELMATPPMSPVPPDDCIDGFPPPSNFSMDDLIFHSNSELTIFDSGLKNDCYLRPGEASPFWAEGLAYDDEFYGVGSGMFSDGLPSMEDILPAAGSSFSPIYVSSEAEGFSSEENEMFALEVAQCPLPALEASCSLDKCQSDVDCAGVFVSPDEVCYGHTPLHHEDHTYSSKPLSAVHNYSEGIHTPADSEDEIDVIAIPEPACPPKRGRSKKNIRSKSSRRVAKSGDDCIHSWESRRQTRSSTSRGLKRLQKHNSKASWSRRRSTNCPARFIHDPDKRNLHNSLERQRRVDLRNCFQFVQSLVPSLSDKCKASKIEILKHSRDFCTNLTAENKTLVAEKTRLQEYHSFLKEKLRKLKLSCL